MKSKKCIIGIFFLTCGLVNLNAQTGSTSSSGSNYLNPVRFQFTEKISMSNVGNEYDTYYLLLCKLLPNATSMISGTIKIVNVRYFGEEYIAFKIIGIMSISDISFTGYAENEFLLLVNENDVEEIDDPNYPTRSGEWVTSGNNIYYNVSNGNVGIGTANPTAKLHINSGQNKDAAILATSSENNRFNVV